MFKLKIKSQISTLHKKYRNGAERTQTAAPSKPCNCGGLHWRYLCPLLSPDDQLSQFKKFEKFKFYKILCKQNKVLLEK